MESGWWSASGRNQNIYWAIFSDWRLLSSVYVRGTYIIYLIAMTSGLLITLLLGLLLAGTQGQSILPNTICMAPCWECQNATFNQCTSCIVSYTLLNNYCVPTSCQVLYCSYCILFQSTTCYECQTNFILINNTCVCQGDLVPSLPGSPLATCTCTGNATNCFTCLIPGCLTCLNSTACSQCAPTYSSNGQGGCVFCNVSNCQTCLSTNFCGVCAGNLTVSLSGTCVACNMTAGCIGCNSGGQCLCAGGYFQVQNFSGNGNFYCQQCLATNCNDCPNSPTSCTQCASGYTVLSGKCVFTGSTVISCASSCLQCYNGGGSCQVCALPLNPLTCNQENIAYCTNYTIKFDMCNTCKLSFNLNSTDRTCGYSGYQYCVNGIVNGKCVACSNYYALANGSCLPCQTGPFCMVCYNTNLTLCKQCISGFYLMNNQCFPCQPYCLRCYDSLSCSETIGITYSPLLSVFDNNHLTITWCPSSCLTCDPRTLFCSSCQPGFYSSQLGICVQCGSNCLTCSASSPSSCLTCSSPDYLQPNGTSCVACLWPCMACNKSSAVSFCLKCGAGYTLSNGTCFPNTCPFDNCMVCNGGSCLQCLPGYFLMNGNCMPGIVACNVSLPANPLVVCLSCYPGSYVDYASTQCVPCPDNCLVCTKASTCSQCLNGYWLTGNVLMVCAPSCQKPCMGCVVGDPSSCTSCIAGYMFVNGTCLPSSCSDSQTCSFCPIGYSLNSSMTCQPCSVSFCATCSNQFAGCTGCLQGYYLSNGSMLCAPCAANCLKCTRSNDCLLCSTGTTQMTYGSTNGSWSGICVPCQAPCASCLGHPEICFSCQQGYFLYGTQCVTNTYFYGLLLANATTQQIFANYPALLSTILTAVGAQSNQFFPTGITGSQGFSFMISSNCQSTTLGSESECLSAGVNNLTMAFNGSQIANLTFLTIQFGNETASSSSPIIGSSQCQSPCLTCTVPGGDSCLSCGRGLVVKYGTCMSAFCSFLNCMTCVTINDVQMCQQCLPTFELINGECSCQQNYEASAFNSPNATCVCALPAGNCTSCLLPNCLTCGSNSTCQVCADGYNLTSQGDCFICDIVNCFSCDVSGMCSQCAVGYNLSSLGGCVLCSNVANCAFCSFDNLCSVCEAGYKLSQVTINNVTGMLCVFCSDPNCYSCSAPNMCSNCTYPYNLVNNSCQPPSFDCELPCALCNYSSNSSTCLYCQSPPYSSSPVNGSCFLCQQPFCSQCNPTNPQICFSCQTGYTLSGSGICTLQLGCSNFSIDGTCNSCQELYALDSGQDKCMACLVTQGCLSCDIDNLTVCTGCITGMFLSNGSCNSCPPLCLSCNSSSCFYYSSLVAFINDQIVVGTCLPPCYCNQSNPYFCVRCDQGYFLSNGTCLPCLNQSLCSACNASNPAQCLVCPINSVLVNGTQGFQVCAYCNQNCLFCLGPNNCGACASGFKVNNGSCVALPGCSQYCYLCGSQGICLQCYPGYVPAGPTCLPGIAGCLVHYPFDPSICLDCVPGTVFNPMYNTCSQCPLFCTTCSVSGVCIQCYSGYYLSGDQNVPCAPSCKYPCTTCSLIDPTLCYSCAGGFVFNSAANHQCQLLINCTGNCLVCPASFMLSSNSTCLACSSNCLTCLPSSPNSCLTCLQGFYVSAGNQCLPCMGGCAQCTSSNLCLQCASGFAGEIVYTDFSSMPPVSSCLACQWPCQTCYVRADFCTSCTSNYTLLGGQCYNNNLYFFQAAFNASQSTFLQNYQTLVNGLLQAVAPQSQMDYGLIFPIELNTSSNSSVVYSAMISSSCDPSTLCSQLEFNNLQKFLAQSAVVNMTIASFSLNASFSYANSGNVSCPPQCVSCNGTTGLCTSCSSGFVVSQGVCVLQNCSVQYCQQCSTNNTCIQCNSMFILTNNTCICQVGWQVVPENAPNATCECNPSATGAQAGGASLSPINFCINCKAKNCLQCSSANNCTSCAAPYSLNSQGICILCNIPDCQQCSQNNFCLQCAGSLQVSSSGDQCILCQVANCLACQSSLNCLACQPGFAMNSDGTACVNCRVPNCLSCQGNGLCGQCAPGYQLINSTCVFSTCQFPCAQCQSGNVSLCSSCVSPPFSPVPANGVCFTCQAANCLNCSSLSPSVCLSCSQGFSLSNGSCLATCIQPQCGSCSSANSSICLVCSSGYFLANSSCFPCAPGCTNCNSLNSCNACLTGFYFINSTCIKCPSFCQTCSTTGSCQVLLPNNNKGQILIQVAGQVKLARCDRGCLSCSGNNPSVCLECRDGLYLSSTICKPCASSSNCRTCSTTDPTQCFTCFPNTFLGQNNICSMCQAPCVTCQETNTSTCLTCPRGYLLQDGQCFNNKCPLLCSSCSSSTFCAQCIDGFVAVNGVCTPCLAGCSQCSTEAPGVCLYCAQGTYLDPSTETCMGCSPNCLSCLPNGCLECRDGFYLTETLTCGQNCLSPCATCSSTNPSECMSCALGYSFNTSALQNCQIDVICNQDFTCTGCPLGYVLSNQQCFQCNNTSCARCDAITFSTCTSCYSGYFLDTSAGTSCSSCPSGCETCLSSAVCLTCASSFTSITDANSGSPVQCVACSVPCLTCYSSPRKCLTCQPGYSLVNAKCISNFNFGFNCTLSVDNPTFYTNYVAFLKALSGNVGEDYGSVAISSIKSSSTVVGGTITTASSPQTSTSQAQYNNLLSSLTTNTQIAGMQVLSSSVTANGGNPNSNNAPSSSSPSSKTWVIVVAVVVPIAVLVIVAVGVFIYCKKKKQNGSQTDEMYMDKSTVRYNVEPNHMEMSDIRKPMF